MTVIEVDGIEGVSSITFSAGLSIGYTATPLGHVMMTKVSVAKFVQELLTTQTVFYDAYISKHACF